MQSGPCLPLTEARQCHSRGCHGPAPQCEIKPKLHRARAGVSTTLYRLHRSLQTDHQLSKQERHQLTPTGRPGIRIGRSSRRAARSSASSGPEDLKARQVRRGTSILSAWASALGRREGIHTQAHEAQADAVSFLDSLDQLLMSGKVASPSPPHL